MKPWITTGILKSVKPKNGSGALSGNPFESLDFKTFANNLRAGNPCKTPYFYINIFERLTIESFRRRISGAKPADKVLREFNGRKRSMLTIDFTVVNHPSVQAVPYRDNSFVIILLVNFFTWLEDLE